MGRMNRLLAAAFAFGLAQAAAETRTNQTFSVTLAPQKVHEVCTQMTAGDKRNYHWKSDGPVDFNIHYHKDKDVFYPVKRDGMRGDGGTFTAKAAEDYCWMWTAKEKAVKVEGRVATP